MFAIGLLQAAVPNSSAFQCCSGTAASKLRRDYSPSVRASQGLANVTLLRLMLCQLIRAEIIGFEPFASAKPDASSSVVPAAQGKQFCPLP